MSLFSWVLRDRVRPFAGIPGPDPSFPLGNGLDFVGKQPWETCAAYGRTYGGLAVTWLGLQPALVLNDPALIGEVLETRSDEFYKKAPCGALTPVITSDDPFVCNGADWREKRAGHPFSTPGLGGWLDGQVEPLRAALDRGVEDLRAASRSGPFDLAQRLQRLSFDAFSVAAIGQPLDDAAYGWWLAMGATGDCRMKLELGLPLPPPLSPFFYRRKRRWFGLFADQVAEARAHPDPARADLLAWSIAQGPRLPDPAFTHALANVFYGGAFSATSGVVTALYLLAHHPAELAKLKAALAPLMAGALTRHALESCAPLDAVLREALRFYTPVPLYFRNSLADRVVNLGGHALPPDTMLMLSSWLLHRSPLRYAKPDLFDPARWADGGVERDPLGSGYFFPFGRGPRTCVGQPFALFYMKLALATLVTRATLELDLTCPYTQRYFFGVMMPSGLKARVVS